jgi:hypothetical protein
MRDFLHHSAAPFNSCGFFNAKRDALAISVQAYRFQDYFEGSE